jgi:hypothetical protein
MTNDSNGGANGKLEFEYQVHSPLPSPLERDLAHLQLAFLSRAPVVARVRNRASEALCGACT